MIPNLKNFQYILIGGYMRSVNDNHRHYISAEALLKLYGLRAIASWCVLCNEEIPATDKSPDDINPFQIILRPRYNRDYSKHLNACIDKWRTICEHK